MNESSDPIEGDTEVVELDEHVLSGFASLVSPGYPDAELVRDAVDHAMLALDPIPVGDHTLAFRLPGRDGVAAPTVELIDVRNHEDAPRHREGTSSFVGVPSFSRYVARFLSPALIVYVNDLYGKGPGVLTSPVTLIEAVLDDHVSTEDPAAVPGRQAHRAQLTLKPTAAGRRWGAGLGRWLDQDDLLDLVVDGAGEIATPDAADLRNLVADLHAIRSTEVKQVKRTGGEGTISLTENVTLHAGPGAEVRFPEQLTVVVQPYAGIPDKVKLEVRVKAKITGNKVQFLLSAPALDDQLASLAGEVAGEVAEQLDVVPLWRP